MAANSNDPNNDNDKLLDHEYDGIKELDHPLPYWWLVTFGITILFGVPYFVLAVWGGMPTLHQEHKVQMAQIKEMREKAKAASGSLFIQEEYDAILKNDGIAKGKIIWNENCVSCHLEQGQGDIGPNLTDEYWIAAKGTPDTMFRVAYDGREEQGMPVWSEVLSKEEIYQAIAYVSTLVGKNVAGKEPQGEKLQP